MIGDLPTDKDEDVVSKLVCGRLPQPWTCSLGPNHEGPCSATRDPNVSVRATHVQCNSFTNYVPKWGFTEEQTVAISKWMDDHDRIMHMKSAEAKLYSMRYSGAIGGAYTYMFTPTSLGTVQKVRCSCGETLDVSDYDSW